ncbi:MAG: 50S ribosomal protein L25/general stress protein Ctc [Aeromicrobium sp.]|uniref:50S ribosomal protein L25/general stress protein Ctc n=1 Tax=Aeromicrobium sp. TaxID=1871063 RepID=UPI003C32086E
MAEIKIPAETRTEFGKGAARRIRRDDKVPAVLYGGGSDPVHVTLPGHALMMALKNSNALLTIDLGDDHHLAIPKQVQRDPIRGFIEHADLLIVKKGQKVTVDITVTLVGEAFPGTMVVHENTTISIEAEATHIPDGLELSIEGLKAGTQLHASDIELPKGTELAVDPEILVVNITNAPTEAELEAELEDAEAEAGIERDESDDEAAAAEGEAAAESSDDE